MQPPAAETGTAEAPLRAPDTAISSVTARLDAPTTTRGNHRTVSVSQRPSLGDTHTSAQNNARTLPTVGILASALSGSWRYTGDLLDIDCPISLDERLPSSITEVPLEGVGRPRRGDHLA